MYRTFQWDRITSWDLSNIKFWRWQDPAQLLYDYKRGKQSHKNHVCEIAWRLTLNQCSHLSWESSESRNFTIFRRLRFLRIVGTLHPRHPRRSGIFTMWSEESEAFLPWRYWSQTSHTVTMSVNMKFSYLGRSRPSAIFTMSVNMEFACLGHRGCLILSFLATIPWFSVNYKCIILSTAARNLSTKKESQSCVLNFIAWKG